MMKNFGFYILYGFVYLFSLLPMWVHYRLSNVVCFIVYCVVRYRRKIVRKNLAASFPDMSEQELRQVEYRFYRFFCDYIVENIKLVTMNKEEVMKRMVFEGIDEMEKSFETHDFVFVYLGHYCNWEYVASLQWWAPKDVRCAQLYARLSNSAFDELFLRIRSRYGGDNINKKESLRHIIDYKNKGQKAIIGFISDQTPKWENIHMWMPFLNHDTPVFTGTERIAKKVNAAFYYGELSQEKRGYYRCRFKLMTNEVNQYGEHELTRVYMELLEQTIKANPQFWLWTHNRWKRQRQEQ